MRSCYETDRYIAAEDGTEFEVQFADPDGNKYEIEEIDHIIETPVLLWKTGGGIHTFGHIHDNTSSSY